jgi:para-aminobenzoate synthetase component II
VEGVQFHPESVLTEGGHRMLANWLATCGHPVPENKVAELEQGMRALTEAAVLR